MHLCIVGTRWGLSVNWDGSANPQVWVGGERKSRERLPPAGLLLCRHSHGMHAAVWAGYGARKGRALCGGERGAGTGRNAQRAPNVSFLRPKNRILR